MRTYFIVIFMALFAPASVFAYEFRAEVRETQIGPGSTVIVDLKLAARTLVNACEGYLQYDSSAFDIVRISSGNSVVNFWIEEPKVTEYGIRFSGATPGAFSGQDNHVLSVAFRAKREGIFDFVPHSSVVYLSDGHGTSLVPRAHAAAVSVDGFARSEHVVDGDTELPEDFTPFIVEHPDMFSGEKTLIFATQDKGSGISHYTVKEGLLGWYRTASSPYLLKHDALHRTIYIRAYDHAGNIRTVIIPATVPRSAFSWWMVGGLTVLTCFALLTIVWKKYFIRR